VAHRNRILVSVPGTRNPRPGTRLLVIALSALSCARGSAPSLSAVDRRAILAIDSAYVTAWLRDDTAGVLATLSKDAVLMPGGQHPLDVSGVKAFWWPNDGSHTRILTFARTIDDVDGNGDLAYVRGSDSFSFLYSKDGATQRMSTKAMTLAVVRRQANGEWRISRMMWSTRTP